MFRNSSKLMQAVAKGLVFLTFFSVILLLYNVVFSPHRAVQTERLNRLEFVYTRDPITRQCYVCTQWEGIASIPCESIPVWIEIVEIPLQRARLDRHVNKGN